MYICVGGRLFITSWPTSMQKCCALSCACTSEAKLGHVFSPSFQASSFSVLLCTSPRFGFWAGTVYLQKAAVLRPLVLLHLPGEDG